MKKGNQGNPPDSITVDTTAALSVEQGKKIFGASKTTTPATQLPKASTKPSKAAPKTTSSTVKVKQVVTKPAPKVIDTPISSMQSSTPGPSKASDTSISSVSGLVPLRGNRLRATTAPLKLESSTTAKEDSLKEDSSSYQLSSSPDRNRPEELREGEEETDKVIEKLKKSLNKVPNNSTSKMQISLGKKSSSLDRDRDRPRPKEMREGNIENKETMADLTSELSKEADRLEMETLRLEEQKKLLKKYAQEVFDEKQDLKKAQKAHDDSAAKAELAMIELWKNRIVQEDRDYKFLCSHLKLDTLAENIKEIAVNLNSKQRYLENTVLHTAVNLNKTIDVALLLKNGADPNLPNSSGQIPLHFALLDGGQEPKKFSKINIEMVESLLAKTNSLIPCKIRISKDDKNLTCKELLTLSVTNNKSEEKSKEDLLKLFSANEKEMHQVYQTAYDSIIKSCDSLKEEQNKRIDNGLSQGWINSGSRVEIEKFSHNKVEEAMDRLYEKDRRLTPENKKILRSMIQKAADDFNATLKEDFRFEALPPSEKMTETVKPVELKRSDSIINKAAAKVSQAVTDIFKTDNNNNRTEDTKSQSTPNFSMTTSPKGKK